MDRIFIPVLFFLLLCPSAPRAAETPLPEIKTVEAYLNGISTLQARFAQTSGDGRRVTGVFMLKRPGRLRFEYDPPVRDFIVADGSFIHYYDGQMKQRSSASIGKSLADFFLRPELRLSGDIGVSGMTRADHLLHVTLLQSRNPMAGSLTLIFGENPLQLKKWLVTDTQGLTTEVELYEAKSGVSFSGDPFHYYDPEKKELFINK